MGFPLAAHRCVIGHGLAHRHDVVSVDLFCRERSEDQSLGHRLRDSPDRSEHGHHRADHRPVRTQPIPSSVYNLLVIAVKRRLTPFRRTVSSTSTTCGLHCQQTARSRVSRRLSRPLLALFKEV